MKIHQILSFLWARRAVVFVVFFVSVLTCDVVVQILPRSYTSSVDIFVDLAGVDPVTGAGVPLSIIRDYVHTQIVTLESSTLAKRVASQLNLTDDPRFSDLLAKTPNVAPLDIIAGMLQRGVSANRQGASDVITIQFDSNDPAFAKRVADGYADALVSSNIERHAGSVGELATWYGAQVRDLRAQQEKLQAQRQALLTSVDGQIGGVAPSGNDVSANQVTLQLSLVQAQSAIEQARAGQAIPDTPAIVRARDELTALEARRTVLLQRVAETHDSVKQVERQIEAAKSALGNVITSERDNFIVQKQAAITNIESQLKQLSLMSGESNGGNPAQDKLAQVSQEVAAIGDQLAAMLKLREQAQVRSDINTTLVSKMGEASLPSSPSSPNLRLAFMMAAVFGVAAGLILAFLREMVDRRVRVVEDVQDALGGLSPVIFPRERPRASGGGFLRNLFDHSYARRAKSGVSA